MDNYEFIEKAYPQTSEIDPISIIYYRGFEIPIFEDCDKQQFFSVIDNREIGFGFNNTDYKEDVKYLIDYKLDTIIEDLPYNARLMWFKNGDSRDIKLVHLGRILKVYLIRNPENFTDQDKQKVILDARELLTKIIGSTIRNQQN